MNLRDQNPRRESKGPWQSREEFLVDVSLQSNLAPEEDIRAIRPVAPVTFLPERRGFTTHQPTIQDVLSADRYAPTNRSWVSGVIVRPSLISDHSWSGTARNSMSEGIF